MPTLTGDSVLRCRPDLDVHIDANSMPMAGS